MRSHRVGELGIVVDLAGGADDFRRDLLVELDVVFKLRDHRARQGLDLDRVFLGLGQFDGAGFVIVFAVGVADDLGARAAFDQHLDGAVGQLEQLQHVGNGADLIDPDGSGSSSLALIWVASMICLSDPITSSSARIDFSRPTNSGTIMCGNTTMSRSGRTG
jgi:hypothetical protein